MKNRVLIIRLNYKRTENKINPWRNVKFRQLALVNSNISEFHLERLHLFPKAVSNWHHYNVCSHLSLMIPYYNNNLDIN